MMATRSHSSEIVSLPPTSADSVQTKSSLFLPSAATPVETSAIERQDSYSVTALTDITDRSLHSLLPASRADFRRQRSAALIWIGQSISLVRQARACSFATRHFVNRSDLQTTLRAVRWKVDGVNVVSNRCPRIGVLLARTGRSGPSISFRKHSFCSSNGGTTPPPACAASQSGMRICSSSGRASFSTWLRRRTSR